MAQRNIIVREQAVYFGEETSFGVTPAGSFPNAMTRTIVAEPIVADGAVREMLDVSDVRVRRLDAIQPRGQQGIVQAPLLDRQSTESDLGACAGRGGQPGEERAGA